MRSKGKSIVLSGFSVILILLFAAFSGWQSLLAEEIEPGKFVNPIDIAVSPDGKIYVVDSFHNCIMMFDEKGKFVRMWGSGSRSWNPELGQLWGESKFDV